LVSELSDTEQQYVEAMLKIGKSVSPADLFEPIKQRGFDDTVGYIRKKLIGIEKKGWIKATEGTRVGGRGLAKRYVVQLSTVRNSGTVWLDVNPEKHNDFPENSANILSVFLRDDF
jgi:hypothetical protein